MLDYPTATGRHDSSPIHGNRHHHITLGDMKMVEAKPNLNNKKDMKQFNTVREAVDYLNEITGFPMDAESWRLIGKLRLIP